MAAPHDLAISIDSDGNISTDVALQAGGVHTVTVTFASAWRTFDTTHAFRLTVKHPTNWANSPFTITVTSFTKATSSLSGDINLNSTALISYLQSRTKSVAVEVWDDTDNCRVGRSASVQCLAPVQRSDDVPDTSQPVRSYTNTQIDDLIAAATGAGKPSTEKTTPVDADAFTLWDSAASDAGKSLTWANLVAAIKTAMAAAYGLLSSAQKATLTGGGNADSLHTHTASAYDGDIADLDIDGGTDIGAALADADLVIVDDGASGTNRKSALSRFATYILAKVTAAPSSWRSALGLGTAATTASTDYATAAQGVTNGDSHDHDGGDGGQIDHTKLSNIGSNSHGTIDTHLGAANPHSGSAASGANSDITSLSGLTTPLSVAQGGTGATTESDARSNLGAGVSARSIGCVFDGGGSVITAGAQVWVRVPYACTITQVDALADQSGSAVVDIWKCSYADFDQSTHPVDGDSITASAPVTISTAVKSTDSTLTGWTTSVSAGDILLFNADSCSSIEKLTIVLKVTT